MLTGEGCNKRVEELLGSLEEEGVDGLLINRPQHLYYLITDRGPEKLSHRVISLR